jgi:hypothetical protein
MNAKLDDALRRTFLAIADVLIPEAEGMPRASQVGVGGEMLDRMLALRPDLREGFMRGLRAAVGKAPAEAAEALNRDDPVAFGAIGLMASAGYYMSPQVRKLIGYPGQESRPADPDETPEYVANGMLQQVIDRGPIFKATPK